LLRQFVWQLREHADGVRNHVGQLFCGILRLQILNQTPRHAVEVYLGISVPPRCVGRQHAPAAMTPVCQLQHHSSAPTQPLDHLHPRAIARQGCGHGMPHARRLLL